MAEPSSNLQALRAKLAAVDDDLLLLVAERLRLVDAVGAVKSTEGGAPFDRATETQKLLELAEKGRQLGVSVELVRGIFGALLANSRASKRARLLDDESRFSIGIIGGTRGMGAFFARIFASAGYPVLAMGLDAGPPAEDVARRSDLVIIAVPISATEAVIRKVAPCVRDGACIADVTSVKTAPLAWMLTHTSPGVDVVGTHPMFRPGEDNDMDRQKVVLCRGRGEPGYVRVRRLFELFGAEVVHADPAEHDAQMALIQVLVHEKTMVLGSVLQRLKAPIHRSLDFASPIYRTELAMIGRLFSQNADLYADILTQNDDGTSVSKVFAEEAARFSAAVETGDREWIVARFDIIALYMRDFAAWAKDESDAILHDVVHRG